MAAAIVGGGCKGGGDKDTAAKVYPKLNHVYLVGEGMAKPAELTQPAHVDRIAAWVTAHGTT
jgi:hypothetical protein